MTAPTSKAKQVSSLGESPAEARRRMGSSGGGATPEAASRPPLSDADSGAGRPLSDVEVATIREKEEGFSGGPAEGDTVEESADLIEPPTPEKAVDTIRQLSQDKLQLQTELDAALAKLQRYEAQFGEID